MCNALTDDLALRGINTYHIIITSKSRADAREYLKRIYNHYHPDMKVPTLRGTNVEEFDLSFTATSRINNNSIGIPLDYILRPDAVGNYNMAWNYHDEKLKFCANLRRQDFNDDAETLYNLLVQYIGTSRTGINPVS